MTIIAPSILSADFAALGKDVQRVLLPNNNYLHVDVMDGRFVPNISLGVPVLKSLTATVPDAFYDVHLMIERPDDYLEAFAKAGANGITFHIESEGDAAQMAKNIKAMGLVAGITLRPGTPAESLYPYLQAVDMVLVMSVEPGFGGQVFMPAALDRIRAIKTEAARQGTPLLIEVDGGINTQTAPQCVAAGADILVAGNAVFGAQDPAAAVRALQGE